MDSITRLSRNFKTSLVLFVLLFMGVKAYAQPSIIVLANYTACPGQPAVITATWNNVAGATYFLNSPPGSQPLTGALAGNTFTVSSPITTATNVTYTLSGSGTFTGSPITSTVLVNLNIVPPAPLTITNTVYYCPGQTAVFVAPIGGFTYNINGPVNLTGLTSNIITLPNVGAGHNGVYTITSVGSCTATGTTTISVAPNTPLAVNAPSNICQGGNVVLTASLVSGSNFQWYNAQGQNIGASATTNTGVLVLAQVTATNGGVVKCTADFPWGPGNTILCPREATTTISVVQTDPVSVVASPANVLCQGDKLSFSALAGNAVGWSWSGPQAFGASIPNPTINPVAPVHAGTYTVEALFTNNVITCKTNNTITIQVVPVNQPVITMPASVCQNTAVIMMATAPSAALFTWFGPNNFNQNSQTYTIQGVQPNASGIYYVTAMFQINTTTCAASNSAQLNVVPVNSITVIPPTPVCQPNHGNLQASAIGANQYVWAGPNGFIAPGPNSTVYYPSISSAGIYTVTAYFNGGNITCPNTNTVQLKVFPVLNFSLIPRQQVCYNTPLSVVGPAGATSYTWTSSTGFTSNSKDINFPSVQPPNSGTYTLNINLGPCITSASTTIDVLTPVQFTLVPQHRTVCKGDTTVLEAGVTGGSQNYAYIWNPAVYFDNPVGPKKTAVPLGSVIYNVIAHDIACPNYTIAQSFSVNVNQPPVPDLQLTKTSGCTPLWINHNPKVKDISAITTYDFGGLKKSQGDSIHQLLVEPGNYSLTVYTKGKNGCGGVFRLPYPIVVFPKPQSSISWTPENPTTTDEVVFSSSAQNGPVLYKQWSFSGGLPSVIDTAIDLSVPGSDTSIAVNPSRRYERIGKFPVMLITRNDLECTDTVVKFLNIIDDFNMFIPNSFTPNGDGINDYFNIKGTGIKTEGYSMEIIDRWGNRLFFTKDVNEGWDGKFKGEYVNDASFIYKIKAVGMNGEGRREFVGYFTAIK